MSDHHRNYPLLTRLAKSRFRRLTEEARHLPSELLKEVREGTPIDAKTRIQLRDQGERLAPRRADADDVIRDLAELRDEPDRVERGQAEAAASDGRERRVDAPCVARRPGAGDKRRVHGCLGVEAVVGGEVARDGGEDEVRQREGGDGVRRERGCECDEW
ncbi:hypothetical protein C8Q76DRAFT_216255 [Earliella scabrosa]|nr:hypothetical protein C8Q76DRAFT_216255 [Earliella scabrosa]